jgi:membrane-bound inhibitor of C-type lysozyme
MNVSTAKILLAGLLAAMPCAGAPAATAPVRYTCSADKHLTVQRNASVARVSLDGRSYDLRRKHSSIGDKYLSEDAAMIIDGSSLVFVADDDLDLGTCVREVPLALGGGLAKPRP